MYSWISGNTWTWIFKPKVVWTTTYIEDCQKTRQWSVQCHRLRSGWYRIKYIELKSRVNETIYSILLTRLMNLSYLLVSNFNHTLREGINFLKITKLHLFFSNPTLILTDRSNHLWSFVPGKSGRLQFSGKVPFEKTQFLWSS